MSSSKLTLTALSLGALMTLSACSLRYDFNTECQSDEDCARFEGSGTFYVCSSNTCTVDASIECRADDDCDGEDTCEQNECVSPMVEDMGSDMPMEEDMPPDMPAEEDMPPDMEIDMGPDESCTLTSECIARFGESYICGADGMCFDALDEFGDCQRVYYSRTANVDNVVYVASLLPLVEPFGTLIGRPLENAMQLAIDEVNGDGGLAGGRKIAWISCDSKGNPQISQRAATHLATRVGVPAIVGPLFSEPFIATVSNVTNNADIFTIAPTATSPSISNQRQGKNLVWRTIASDTFQAHAFVQRVNDLGPGKVLMLYKDDKYGDDLQSLIRSELQPSYQDNLRVVKLPNPIDLEDPSDDGIRTAYGGVIAGALNDGFVPDAVIIIGTNEGALAAGAYIVVATAGGIPLPSRFLLSHGVVPAMEELAIGLEAQQLGALIPLFEGISPSIFDPESEVYRDYRTAYSIAFNNTQPALASTTTFDSLMTIAFSMATIPADEEITGPKIASGIARLVDKDAGTPLTFYESTSFVSSGVNALQSGDNLDIEGVSGNLDFDLDTGDVYAPQIGWTLTQDPMTMRWTLEQARIMSFPNAPDTTDAVWTPIMMMP